MLHRLGDGVLGRALDGGIDGEHDVVPVLRVDALVLGSGDPVAVPSVLAIERAGRARQRLVVAFLDAGQALAVDVHHTEDLRSQVAVRIAPPHGIVDNDARDRLSLDPLGHVRIDLTLDIDPVGIHGDLFAHVLALEAELTGEHPHGLLGLLDVLGLYGDVLAVDALGKHVAVAVVDRAAFGRQLDAREAPRIRARHVGVAVHDRVVDELSKSSAKAGNTGDTQKGEPQHAEALVLVGIGLRALRARTPTAQLHSTLVWTEPAQGLRIAMLRSSAAI